MNKDISWENITSHISHPLSEEYKLITCTDKLTIAAHKSDRTAHTVDSEECFVSGKFTTRDSKGNEKEYKKLDIHCRTVMFY